MVISWYICGEHMPVLDKLCPFISVPLIGPLLSCLFATWSSALFCNEHDRNCICKCGTYMFSWANTTHASCSQASSKRKEAHFSSLSSCQHFLLHCSSLLSSSITSKGFSYLSPPFPLSNLPSLCHPVLHPSVHPFILQLIPSQLSNLIPHLWTAWDISPEMRSVTLNTGVEDSARGGQSGRGLHPELKSRLWAWQRRCWLPTFLDSLLKWLG